MYLDANNPYGWAMSQKLPVDGFKWIKQLCEDNDKGYILEVDMEYPKNLFNIHSDLPFLPERKKIKKCKKLVCNIHNKANYVVHIRTFK